MTVFAIPLGFLIGAIAGRGWIDTTIKGLLWFVAALMIEFDGQTFAAFFERLGQSGDFAYRIFGACFLLQVFNWAGYALRIFSLGKAAANRRWFSGPPRGSD